MNYKKSFEYFHWLIVNTIKRKCLRLILGKPTYNYMCESLLADRRLVKAHTVDIIIRKDGIERRIEADWCKSLAEIVWTFNNMGKAELAGNSDYSTKLDSIINKK